MRLTKSYKGETYLFNVKVINYHTKECTIQPYHTSQFINGIISNDLKTISFDEPILLNSEDRTSSINITTLKVNKDHYKNLLNDFEFILR